MRYRIYRFFIDFSTQRLFVFQSGTPVSSREPSRGGSFIEKSANANGDARQERLQKAVENLANKPLFSSKI